MAPAMAPLPLAPIFLDPPRSPLLHVDLCGPRYGISSVHPSSPTYFWTPPGLLVVHLLGEALRPLETFTKVEQTSVKKISGRARVDPRFMWPCYGISSIHPSSPTFFWALPGLLVVHLDIYMGWGWSRETTPPLNHGQWKLEMFDTDLVPDFIIHSREGFISSLTFLTNL